MITVGICANSRAHDRDFVTVYAGAQRDVGWADVVATLLTPRSSRRSCARRSSASVHRAYPSGSRWIAMREGSGGCVT